MEDNITKKLGRPRNAKYPTTLICSLSGKVVKTNSVMFRKLLEKSGLDQETFITTYVCRAERKNIDRKNRERGLNPPLLPELQEMNKKSLNTLTKKEQKDRKELVKTLWAKVAQQPAEYYQEKIKNSKRG